MDFRCTSSKPGGSLERWHPRMTSRPRRSRRASTPSSTRRIGSMRWSGGPTALADHSRTRHGRVCYERDLVTIAVSPESDAFERSFEGGAFEPDAAHEMRPRHSPCRLRLGRRWARRSSRKAWRITSRQGDGMPPCRYGPTSGHCRRPWSTGRRRLAGWPTTIRPGSSAGAACRDRVGLRYGLAS